jgi:hypothetical protein
VTSFLDCFSISYRKTLILNPKVVELPPEVAKRITFEEQVIDINVNGLQEVVDK